VLELAARRYAGGCTPDDGVSKKRVEEEWTNEGAIAVAEPDEEESGARIAETLNAERTLTIILSAQITMTYWHDLR